MSVADPGAEGVADPPPPTPILHYFLLTIFTRATYMLDYPYENPGSAPVCIQTHFFKQAYV